MEQWVDEVNFADSGFFLGDLHAPTAITTAAGTTAAATTSATVPSTHESSGSSADGGTAVSTPLRCERTSTIVSPQWPLNTPTPTPPTPTPATPQELRAAAIAAGIAPSFETYLGVPPAFVFQCARSRTEAALLYEVTSVALEMDVLLENVREQLHDRRRVSDWRTRDATERRNKASSSSVMVMETALLALQQQAHGVNERNLLLLLERFHLCLQKLFDLQFPLAQSIEHCEISASELEDLGKLDSAALRRKLAARATAHAATRRCDPIGEQLGQRRPTFAAAGCGDKRLLARGFEFRGEVRDQYRFEFLPHALAVIDWVLRACHDEWFSKRSTMDDVRLSSSSSSMHSTFSASSALEERRRHIEDAEDLNRTLIDHREFPKEGDKENENAERQDEVGPDQAIHRANEENSCHSSQQSNHQDDTRSLSPAVADVGARVLGGGGRERPDRHPSDHALSESVY